MILFLTHRVFKKSEKYPGPLPKCKVGSFAVTVFVTMIVISVVCGRPGSSSTFYFKISAKELCKSSIDICIKIFPDNIHKMGKFKRMVVLLATDEVSLNSWFGRKNMQDISGNADIDVGHREFLVRQYPISDAYLQSW